jgi:hypothetical protein
MIATILCLFIGAAITIGTLLVFANVLVWMQDADERG